MRYPCPECGAMARVRSYFPSLKRMRLVRHGVTDCDPGPFRPGHRPLWSFEEGWERVLELRQRACREALVRELMADAERLLKREREVLAFVAAVDTEEEAERAARGRA